LKTGKLGLYVTLLLPGVGLHAAPLTREAVLTETLQPYTGPTVHGVDTHTLTGKVMCGYQGWFNVEGDGAERGNIHWTKHRGPLAPGNAKIDLWPDVSELGADERFATGFKFTDGRTAEVFSSFKQTTVLRDRWCVRTALRQRPARPVGAPAQQHRAGALPRGRQSLRPRLRRDV
jgi:hypothetical protein